MRPYQSHKLAFQSKPCTFLGYNTFYKGYKCLSSDGRIFAIQSVMCPPITSILQPPTMNHNKERHNSDTSANNTDNMNLTNVYHLETSTQSSSQEELIIHEDTCDGATSAQSTSSLPKQPLDDASITICSSIVYTHSIITRCKNNIFKPKVCFN